MAALLVAGLTGTVSAGPPPGPQVLDAGGGRASSSDYTMQVSVNGLGGAVLTAPNYHLQKDILAESLTPEIEVAESQPTSLEIESGGTSLFTGLIVGRSASKTYLIRNVGTVDLTGISVTLEDQPDSDFSLSGSPLDILEPGESTSFTITYQPSTPGARRAKLQVESNDGNENPYGITLSGIGIAKPVIAFSQAIYSISQGELSVQLRLVRTGGHSAASVKIQTSDGMASSVPPFETATAGEDYITLSEPETTLFFAENEWEKTVPITLTGRTLAKNARFNVALSEPSEDALLGPLSLASVELLTADDKNPSLTLRTPSKGANSTLSPLLVIGTAGDAKGIRKVEVSLNDETPQEATLGMAKANTSVPFSLPVSPIEGDNTLVITAYDLAGNMTTLTRSFTLTRRYLLTLDRQGPGGASIDAVGKVTLKAAPTSAASALIPTTANTNPKTSEVLPNTPVTLTAIPGKGFAFSHWIGLPEGSDDWGNIVRIMMPAEAVTIAPVFVASPFAGEAGSGGSFYGIISVENGIGTPSNATEGFLTGTLTTTGAFSGKLFIGGLVHPLTAIFFGDGSAVFTRGKVRSNPLSLGTQSLTLSYNAATDRDCITATLTDESMTSQGSIWRTPYSKARPIPSQLRNASASTGFYTLSFPSQDQIPSKDVSSYPQGYGFATLKLTAIGGVTMTGTLADGSVITAASALARDDASPVFSQIATPGSPKIKGGSFSGELAFADLDDSDVIGQYLQWFRPTVTPLSSPATHAAATALYTTGWPEGIRVSAIGSLYATRQKVDVTLNVGPVNATLGNGRLEFLDGKLDPPMPPLTSFNISGNTITTLPKKGASFTLVPSASTGSFKGTFTPTWPVTNKPRPAFRGILLQKGARQGGYGFFLSNAPADADPESGSVTLSRQPSTPGPTSHD